MDDGNRVRVLYDFSAQPGSMELTIATGYVLLPSSRPSSSHTSFLSVRS